MRGVVVACMGVALSLGCSETKEPEDEPQAALDGGTKTDTGSGGTGAGGSSSAGSGGTAASGSGAGGSSSAGSGGGSGGTRSEAGRDAGPTGGGTRDAATTPKPTVECAARAVDGDARMHFHHVHFNSPDPDADLDFFERFLGAPPVDFCSAQEGNGVTRATKTQRGYFLYTQVAQAPDPRLNTYLEHVGWIHPQPNEELARLVDLGVMLWPEGRAQCADAAMGVQACAPMAFPTLPYWFYLQAPSGARIEVALGPGPATEGFGHVHLIQGVDLTFFETVTGGAYADGAIDMVNHTDVSLTEEVLAGEDVVDTRGRPIDHLGYSTTDLDAEKARIEAAGIEIAEDISFKPAFGFRSFFVRSPKGIWLEILEDTPFTP